MYRFPTSFPANARWNADRQAVEFGVEIGEYRSVVGVTRGACSSGPLPERPTPERCDEAYYFQRTRFESIAKRKLRRRQLNRGRECGDQRAGFTHLRWHLPAYFDLIAANGTWPIPALKPGVSH